MIIIDWELKYKKLMIMALTYTIIFLLIGVLGSCFLIVYGRHNIGYYLTIIESLIGIVLGLIVFIGLLILTIKEDITSTLNIDSKNYEAQIKYFQFKKELEGLKNKEKNIN